MSLDAERGRRGLIQLAGFRKLNTKHLEELMFDGSSLRPHSREVTAWRIIHDLRERGLITALDRPVARHGGGSARPVYQLTDDGRRHLISADPALRWVSRPLRSAESIEHSLMAAELYVAFMRAARSNPGHDMSRWQPDWRAAELVGSPRVVPDGFFSYTTGEWVVDAFVEVDLGTESASCFGRKVAQYIAALRRGNWRAQLRRWPVVVTVTPERRRASSLRAAAENVLRRERDPDHVAKVAEFDFAALPDLSAPDGPLGRVWQIAGRDGLHPFIPSDDAIARSAEPSPHDVRVAAER